jgi:hypothetical protein
LGLEKVYEMWEYSQHVTDRVYVHELLSAVTVLVEGRVLLTAYYLNLSRVFKITCQTMYWVLRGYLTTLTLRFPNTPQIVMGDLNPTTVEPEIKPNFFDGIKRDGFTCLETIYDLNALDFVFFAAY